MDFFETVQKRRSIRRYKDTVFPDEHVEKALEAAILAPNSSNTQTWSFHWIKSDEMKKKFASYCLNQSAARTASHMVVFTADPIDWKRSHQALIRWVENVKAPEAVISYYRKLVPFFYRSGLFNLLAPFKYLIFFFMSLKKPSMRGPNTLRDNQEVAIKSAALAAENFVLAIVAQDGATCMIEGFDEKRVKKELKLPRTARVVMVVSVGYEADRATWGPQFRLPLKDVLKIY